MSIQTEITVKNIRYVFNLPTDHIIKMLGTDLKKIKFIMLKIKIRYVSHKGKIFLNKLFYLDAEWLELLTLTHIQTS